MSDPAVPGDPVSATPRAIGGNGRDAPELIYDRLRRQILTGELSADAQLSQAGVASELGISRGPVREAFRMLERDGLIETQVNQRATITSLSVPDLEHAYALRIVNESLALAVGVMAFTAVELDELDRLVGRVDEARGQPYDVWEHHHQGFHNMLLMHAGGRMRQSLAQWADHTERYRRVYVAQESGGWTLGVAEHTLLVDACRARDVNGATTLLARHLSRAALSLIAVIDPEHDPVLLRHAIRQVTGS